MPRCNFDRLLNMTSTKKITTPVLLIAILPLFTALWLKYSGRNWLAPDGSLHLWYGLANGSGTSQHLLDPYSFTHFLHGFVFCWLIMLAGKSLPYLWQLTLAIAAESAWEIAENSETIINRYREATIALGYFGDSIINSMSDILVCALGFVVAARLGFKKSLAVFFTIELLLLLWVRDNLTLNIIMLIKPVAAIKLWQSTI